MVRYETILDLLKLQLGLFLKSELFEEVNLLTLMCFANKEFMLDIVMNCNV